MSIDISNFINISIATTPTSMNERNVGVIALFTKEPANIPINNYVIYKSPSVCANDFGIDSMTYKMVNAIFSQSPNILNANGYVMVFPTANTSVSATSGSATFSSLLYKNFTSINNGSFKIIVDGGTEETISDLDFTNVNSFESFVEVFENNTTLTSLVNISSDVNNSSITFTSLTTGTTSNIIIASSSTGTDITTTNYLNILNGVYKDGENAYSGTERLQDIFLRTQGIAYYFGCIPCWNATDNEIMATASLVQSTNSALIVTKNDTSYTEENSANIFYKIKQSGLTHTRCLYYGGESEFLTFGASYLSSYMSVNYNGNNTVKNLHSKELIGILPDDTINETILNNANNIGVDLYPIVGGVGAVFCSGANEWFDTVAGLTWLKMSLENAGFSTLRNVGSKIPQTEQGVSMMYNAYNEVLKMAVNNGFIAPGSWTLPTTFGNQELMLQNITNFGFYIYFEPVATQSQSEREKRRLPYCQMAIKLAGANNSSNVLIYVNN